MKVTIDVRDRRIGVRAHPQSPGVMEGGADTLLQGIQVTGRIRIKCLGDVSDCGLHFVPNRVASMIAAVELYKRATMAEFAVKIAVAGEIDVIEVWIANMRVTASLSFTAAAQDEADFVG